MNDLEQVRRLWAHAVWADESLFAGLQAARDAEEAWREYAHVLAADEVWLARLEGRSRSVAVWPALSEDGARELRERVAAGFASYLAGLDASDLSRPVSYTNSAGLHFETPIGEILLHVVLHGQYHRGKVNLLLRQGGADPVPVDYIGFVRGAPAAVTPVDD